MSDLPDNYGHKNLSRTASSFKDDFISLIKSIADLPHYHWVLNSKWCGKEYDNFKIWMDWNAYLLYMCCFFDFDLGNVRSWYMFQTKIEKLNFSILMGYFLNKKLNGNRTTDNCHISAIQQNIKDTKHACATHILSFTATCCTLTNALV